MTSQTEVETTLNNLKDVAYTMGVRFNTDKTKIYHSNRDYQKHELHWMNQALTVKHAIIIYLGHIIAHPTYEDQAWEMATDQLRQDLAAYNTLPLNSFEKTTIVNAVLIPRWTYRALFIGNRQRMAQWDHILLAYLRDTPGVENTMNKLRMTTDVSQGGLGLRQLWWAYISRWIGIGRQEVVAVLAPLTIMSLDRMLHRNSGSRWLLWYKSAMVPSPMRSISSNRRQRKVGPPPDCQLRLLHVEYTTFR